MKTGRSDSLPRLLRRDGDHSFRPIVLHMAMRLKQCAVTLEVLPIHRDLSQQMQHLPEVVEVFRISHRQSLIERENVYLHPDSLLAGIRVNEHGCHHGPTFVSHQLRRPPIACRR